WLFKFARSVVVKSRSAFYHCPSFQKGDDGRRRGIESLSLNHIWGMKRWMQHCPYKENMQKKL
uniref:hypothetical protein n=1 Tax=Segatella hominis TaxID=2518605 RepID=UPI0040287A8C